MKAETLVKDFTTTASAVRVPARAPRWVVPLVKTLLVFTDAGLALGCFVLAFYVRHYQSIVQRGSGGLGWSHEFAPYAVLLPLIIPIRLLLLRYYDLYRLRGEFSLVDDMARVFKATAISSLLIVAAAFLYRGGVAFRTFSYSRGIFVLDFLLVLSSITLLRMLLRRGQIVVRRRGINLIPTLIVGRGREASVCISEMRARPELGYRVIGIIDNERSGARPQAEMFEGVPVIGDLRNLPEAIRESRANEVIISDPNVPGEALFEVMIQTGRRRGVEFRIAPTLLNCLPSKTEIDQVGSLPMVTLFRSPLSSGARIVKRTSDLTIAAAALIFLSPLWLLIALLIKLDSRGAVFYKQERVGMDGRIFLFYKFRTMHVDADDSRHREYQRAYIHGRPDSNLGDDERPVFKLRSDERITRLGRILRRTSLDELPQLFNVVRGDMSIVGPRPPIPYEVENYQLWHRKRLDMKPGITGLWQVSGRNRLPFDEMVRMDLYYIENWSLLLDFKIILQTLPVMWRGEDAY
jgi:exopolysaccharide biosynthesis polyprenyl glycosylphosphotransferase